MNSRKSYTWDTSLFSISTWSKCQVKEIKPRASPIDGMVVGKPHCSTLW